MEESVRNGRYERESRVFEKENRNGRKKRNENKNGYQREKNVMK